MCNNTTIETQYRDREGEMEKTFISFQIGGPSADWHKKATAEMNRKCQERGISVKDAEVLVKLPESGRCFYKPAGYTQLGAHG